MPTNPRYGRPYTRSAKEMMDLLAQGVENPKQTIYPHDPEYDQYFPNISPPPAGIPVTTTPPDVSTMPVDTTTKPTPDVTTMPVDTGAETSAPPGTTVPDMTTLPGVEEPVGFPDVMAPIEAGYKPPELPSLEKDIEGRDTLERALGQISPESAISPAVQQALDVIRERTERARERGISEAQALAAKRGLTGSSIEQFGVAEASEAAERVGREAETSILMDEVSQRRQLASQRAKGLFGRAAQEAELTSQLRGIEFQAGAAAANLTSQLDLNSRIRMAELTSDELASIRAMIDKGQDRELQRYLGERGIAVAMQNINLARQNAKSQANQALWGGIGTLVGGTLGWKLGGPFGGAVGGFIGGAGGAVGNFIGGTAGKILDSVSDIF